MSTRRSFRLPDLGEGLTEAEIVAWRVQPGDAVTLNQVLVEVETEKAVVELPSPYAGSVVALLADAGAVVEVGTPIVTVDTLDPAETSAPMTAALSTEEPHGTHHPAQPEQPPSLVGYGTTPGARSRRRRRPHRQRRAVASTPGAIADRPFKALASPPVRFMARQLGIDLSEVTGRGPGGIVTRDDLAAHLAAHRASPSSAPPLAPQSEPQPAQTGGELRMPLRGVQRHMAEAVTRSAVEAPQACVFLSVDVTPTRELVEQLRHNRQFDGLRLTALVLVAKAVLGALPAHPALNSSWDDERQEVVYRHDVNLGVAVAAPSGLLVPTIKGASALSLRDLAAALSALTERARAGRCTVDELRGGTFTITNVGVFGVDGGVPIVSPGEAGILAFGAVRRRPWELRGAVALRDVTTLTLTFDHRLVDGRQASEFLTAVGDFLAEPTGFLAFA